MSPETHIADLARHFSAGRYDLVADGYVYPLPVYLDGKLTVAQNRGEFWAILQTLHSCLAAEGLPRIEGKLVSFEVPQRQRFRLWVEWSGQGTVGSRPAMRSLCFNRGTHSDFLCEMIQITTDAELTALRLQPAA